MHKTTKSFRNQIKLSCSKDFKILISLRPDFLILRENYLHIPQSVVTVTENVGSTFKENANFIQFWFFSLSLFHKI